MFRYTDPKAVNRRMKAVCRRAGIEYRSTHSAGRHSFGTNAMKEGADVKEAMDAGRWKSAKLFLETYVHSEEAGRQWPQSSTKTRLASAQNWQRQRRSNRYHFGKKQ